MPIWCLALMRGSKTHGNNSGGYLFWRAAGKAYCEIALSDVRPRCPLGLKKVLDVIVFTRIVSAGPFDLGPAV